MLRSTCTRSIRHVIAGRSVLSSSSSRASFWSGASTTATGAAATATASHVPFNAIPHIDPSFIPFILALLLANADQEDEATSGHGSNTSQQPPWQVTNTSKGQGAFADRDIHRGERLIAERPLCIWPQNLSSEQAASLLASLEEPAQRSYLALSRSDEANPKTDNVRAIRATNGFAVQLQVPDDQATGKTAPMVFPKIARINHSCTPNCSQAMNPRTLRMEVYALNSLPKNTEITIEYLPLITSTRAERRAALVTRFGFSSCLCDLCAAPDDVVAQSDQRRIEMRKLGEGIKRGRADRAGTMARFERIRVLLEEEGYNGLPEFDDVSVSNAYAVYAGMYMRSRQREASTATTDS